ncbi:BrnA antitoxin family protein [Candidatus Magnetomonas plexicatena]|uniref:BrnA antitoxin family protein n=1 Tax=Candidatus Magnetomonas plexicatena TaxID=2552947 RepID=UPI001C766056|nr:hypothetical protein E2O03_015185 [Nitrospirales bacterium LBB_01]
MNKNIPDFATEDEERAFWNTHDSSDFVDWKKAKQIVLSELKPTLRTISLRLPESMIAELKLLAHKKDVPYQALLKMFLSEKIAEELKVH